MRFGSVCSGIEAASVAFEPLGWKAAWLAEIEPFPSAVLAHHYPDVPNLGDMTQIADRIAAGDLEAPDLLCGGCPCQSFSVAGLRKSLGDARGNLTIEFIRIADAIDSVRHAHGLDPAWVFYENVPGILSTSDNAFGAFLGGLCGGDTAFDPPADGWPNAGVVSGPRRVVAWRVLDAQYFGVAQRRRRVFVLALGGAGGWACADALLPISDRMSWHPAPRRQTRQGSAAGTLRSTDGGSDVDHARAGHLVPAGGSRHNNHWSGGVHPPLSQASQTRGGGIGQSNQEIFEQGGAGLVPDIASTLLAQGNSTGGDRPPGTTVDTIGTLICMAHGQGNAEIAIDHGPTLTYNHEAPIIAHSLRGEGFDASEDGTGRGTPLVPVFLHMNKDRPNGRQSEHEEMVTVKDHVPTITTGGAPGAVISFHGSQDPDVSGDITHPLGRNYGQEACIAFDTTQITSPTCRSNPQPGDPCHTMSAQAHAPSVAYTTKLHNTASNNAGKIFEERATCLDANSPPPALLTAMQVRRLTPRECERLQGFPDNYTLIPVGKKMAADGPRYKALGNSWAVPNARWIGQRIQAVTQEKR